MAKVMLVEDDNNLREIYGARLRAEGYGIVSAKDGEEALALAVKEKPDLIISDIMMPKISGFDMLDILHSTPETRNTKIIMMTALSQAEDKEHADRLGADRYLVKSQVTLEDVVRVAKEVLEGTPTTNSPPAPTVTTALPISQDDNAQTTAVQNDQGTPDPIVSSAPAIPEENTTIPTTSNPQASAPSKAEPITAPTPPPPPDIPVAAPSEAPTTNTIPSIPITVTNQDADTPLSTEGQAQAKPTTDATSNDKVLADAVAKVSSSNNNPAPDDSSSDKPRSRVIQPLNDITQTKPDIHELLAKEEAKERQNGTSLPIQHTPQTTINPSANQPQPPAAPQV